MKRETESIEALRLKCTLADIKIMSLERELEAEREKLKEKEKAHNYFIDLISNPRGYKQWLKNKLINEAQAIKVA